MFTQLTLRNFKAWRERIEIPLAPVTVLLGTNSSGKSSLLQALLLMKQTVLSPDRSIHLNFGGDDASDYFNFGHFEDVLTRGASPRQFEIGFNFHSTFDAENNPTNFSIGEFSADYGMTQSRSAVIQYLDLFGYKDNFDAKDSFQQWVGFRITRHDKGAYSILNFEGSESRLLGKSRDYAPERSIALPAEAIRLLAHNGIIAEDISLAIRRELLGIAYLGPLRRKPERDYVWNKSKPGELGTDGAGFVNALFDSAFHRSKNGDPSKIVEEVSS